MSGHVILCLIIGAVFTIGGALLADRKNRSPLMGAALGLFLHLIGIIIIACLKRGEEPLQPFPRDGSVPPAGWYRNPDSPGERYWNGLEWSTRTKSKSQ